MEIKITLNSNPAPKPDPSTLGFGKIFTDHMFMWSWNSEKGWYNPRIVPFERLSIHPASTVLHYGSEIFEGLKAYRRADGKVQLFRPIENIRRMNNSAERLCLPQLPEEDAMQALTEFVKLEQDWTPSAKGTSLYLRPFMFGNDESLGVHAVHNAEFIIIASPVGSYYKEGINPVKIMIEDEDVVERKYIEEVGAMNVMFKINGKVITPKLVGSILPGITRKSIIDVLKSEGVDVEERLLSVEELSNSMLDGTLEEAWGCGTAAVVSPIGELCYKDHKYTVNNGEIGALTQHLYDTLTGIQWGELEDKFGWTVEI